jgi:hypothetical protein
VTKIQCDLAISAVASDAEFVQEFAAEIATRLHTAPFWRCAPALSDEATALSAHRSRVALVLHQQLWQHDPETQREAAYLRERVGHRSGSVSVLTLDATPVPGWLAGAPKYDLATAGRSGAVEFVVNAVASEGGCVKPATHAGESEPAARWPDPPPPFMSQPRAFTALRHEFDIIVAELESVVDDRRSAQPEHAFELQVLPHRAVARLGEVAISFSWVTGHGATVADGRLMVIAWRDVAHGIRGLDALRSAKPVHERVYRPEGGGPANWCWRADDLTGQPYSSANLAAQWIARASIARGE